MSRLVASRLTETANWQVFVENVPGAGNNTWLRAGARAAPDGYTLVMGETSNLAVNPYLYKSLDFSAVDDLVPVALMGSGRRWSFASEAASTALRRSSRPARRAICSTLRRVEQSVTWSQKACVMLPASSCSTCHARAPRPCDE